jgi:bifunctional ADP-heptose synthase (sugar kinase/adenylyltransferase)
MTRSEYGAYSLSEHGEHFVAAHPRSISDVSGAGDTVVSTSALCLAMDLPDLFLAELANLAGGLVCEHLGVVSIDRNHLIEEAIKHKL